MRDLADLAGVSPATVSRALNGRDEVSRATREAVVRMARRHGYSANRSAQALAAGRTGLVGVTVPMVHHSYFAVILAGITEALHEHDLRAVLCPTHHEHDREVSLLERLIGGTTDGALLVLPEESEDELSALGRHGYHFVVVDPLRRLDERIPAVSAAHSAGAAEATRLLLDLGHRRIGVVTGPPTWLATEERLQGHRAALVTTGAVADPALEEKAGFDIESGAAAASRLLACRRPPTAIFAFNDPMAIGTLQAARAAGLRVPEDLSVVGFDDTPEASIVSPTLTTVRQPLAEMGRMAVNLLARLLRREPFEALHIELATKLVVRGSTAPPRRP
ncbi:MAG: LacI family DNA-binding transcriptional regulator [Acidimicrobiales bacterium]